MGLAFAASAQAAAPVDQQQLTPNWGGTQLGNETWFDGRAQTFTAGRTGPLSEVRVYIWNQTHASYDVRAEIATTSGGVPTFTSLATSRVHVGPEFYQGWLAIPFASPTTVTKGTQYAIELWAESDTVIAKDFAFWGTGAGTSYAQGDCYIQGWEAWGWISLGMDFAFQTFVTDVEPPTITPPGDVTAEVPSYMGTAVSFGAISATDDVDHAMPASSIHCYSGYQTDAQAEVHSGDIFPVGTTTVTAAATDSSGNTGTATFTVTVRNTAPQLLDQGQPSSDGQLACEPGSTTLYAQTFTAASSGPLTTAAIDILTGGSSFDVQAQVVALPLSGPPSGNQVLATAVSHVAPSDGPLWLDFAFASPAVVTDGTEYALVISFGESSEAAWCYSSLSPYGGGEAFEWGSWLETDTWSTKGWDFAFKTFSEAPDTTLPEVTPPADVAMNPAGASEAPVAFGTGTAIDNVDGLMSAAAIHYYIGYDSDALAEVHSGDTFPLGTTTVTVTATDRSGNTGVATFTVAVNSPPVVTPPANVTADAPSYLGTAVSFDAASAADDLDGALSADSIRYYSAYNTASQAEAHPGDTFPLGATTVTVAATDNNGATGTATFTVTVNNIAPQLLDQEQSSCETYESTQSYMRWMAQTFTAGHDGPLNKVSVYLNGAVPYRVTAAIFSTTSEGLPDHQLAYAPVYVTTGGGHWQDIALTSPPMLTQGAQYAIVLRYANDFFTWAMASSDPYAGGAAYTYYGGQGGWFLLTTSGGSSFDRSFRTYHEVPDTTPPEVDPLPDLTVDAADDLGGVVDFALASATDDHDGVIASSSIHYYTGYGTPSQAEVQSGDTFPVGTTAVTVTATDRSLNTGTASFAITVREPFVEVLDQRQEDHMAGLVPLAFKPSDANAQSFSPGHSGPLTKVSLFISNDYADPYDAQVEICAWPLSGLPADAQILATSSVHFSGVATDYWQDVTFSSPPTLTAGTQYAIVVTGARFSWYTNGMSYLPGRQYLWTGSTWFDRGYRASDFQFRTYSLVRRGTPTDITSDKSSVDENLPAGTLVGNFAATDPDSADTLVYGLVDGIGAGDNELFTLDADGTLKTANPLNYEGKYFCWIRVRTTDASGLSCEKMLQITIKDVNEPPTDINMHLGSIDENQPLGTCAAWFDTVDPEGGTDTHTYALVDGEGSVDNALFSFNEWQELISAAVFDHETKSSYSIRLRSTDVANHSVDKVFTIAVKNVNEAPLAGTVSIDNGSPKTNDALAAVPSGFTDPDGDTDLDHYTYVWSKNGTAIGGETGSTLDLSKAGNGDKGDVITVSVRAVDKDSAESDAAVSTGVTIVNSPPVLASITDKSGPFGNALTFTASASDADGDPITYGLGSGSVGSIDATTGAYSWTPGPTAIGDHSLSVIASDGPTQDAKTVTIKVTKRTASIATCDVQSAVVKTPVKISGSLIDSGDLNNLLVNAKISVTLTPVAGGSPITLGPIDVGSDGKFSTSFTTPTPIPFGSYDVCLVVSGASYVGTAPWCDAVAVYDPAAGFGGGGGWFLWPGTTQKTTFGFVTNYQKNGTNFKGSLVMVRHLPDGTIYRIKSNAVGGLAISSPTRVGGWVSFNGKANYMDPTMSSWLGGYTFNMYAEDNNQPGTAFDKFWIQLMYNGAIVGDCSMASATGGSTVPAVPLGGGNVVVPHK